MAVPPSRLLCYVFPGNSPLHGLCLLLHLSIRNLKEVSYSIITWPTLGKQAQPVKGLTKFIRYNEVSVYRVSFSCFTYWGKENRSLYRGLRYTEPGSRSGGGGYLKKFRVGMCRWDPRTLNLYQNKFSWILLPYNRVNSPNPPLS